MSKITHVTIRTKTGNNFEMDAADFDLNQMVAGIKLNGGFLFPNGFIPQDSIDMIVTDIRAVGPNMFQAGPEPTKQ